MTTDRKTLLSIFRRIDAGNVPAPWVPPELPASTAAPVAAKRDRTQSLPAILRHIDAGNVPAPWVPAELPASAVPVAVKPDRGKLKPWVPAAEAPRDLPAVAGNGGVSKTPEQAAEQSPVASVAPGGTTIINNIVQQVAAPAPVYVPWGWGWSCSRRSCPHRVGRPCRRLLCW